MKNNPKVCFLNGYHILFKKEELPLVPSFTGDKATPSHSHWSVCVFVVGLGVYFYEQ